VNRPLLVVGDALLDVDVVGSVERVCPDAPALVVEAGEERARPGGAALAAALAGRTGAEVVLLAPLADDEDAERLAALLAEEGVRVVRLPWTGTTPVKQRVRSCGQTLVRLDRGGRPGTVGPVPAEARAALEAAAGVLVSDYGRGAAADPAVRDLLTRAARRGPVVWDPHPRGAPPVPGTSLVTPNRAEAALLAPGETVPGGPLDVAAECAARLVGHWSSRAVVVTLGDRGAVLSYGEDPPLVVPAPRVPDGDTCGAGDAFAATAAVALSRGALPSEAVATAVEAAAAFVAGGGAAGMRPVAEEAAAAGPAPAPDDDAHPLTVVRAVRARGGRVVATGGCFDLLHAGHVATLEAARALGDCLVVCLNSDASVRRLKGPDRPLVGEQDRARVLRALRCVDAVLVFGEDEPGAALQQLRPDLWVKGGDYSGTRLPEADVLAEWGGRAVVLPYLQGRSTTGLVRAAAGRPPTTPTTTTTQEDQ
jgi:rfaE bifunctional protein nucleotidyltransferase chain/domain/rfaE bifunctional protein kinase chain/domain